MTVLKPTSCIAGSAGRASHLFALISLLAFICDFGVAATVEFEITVSPFLEQHCIKCHGDEKQKGDVRLDTLDWDFSHGATAVAWQDISDMLILGDMPPEDEPRPPSELVTQMVEAIDGRLRLAAKENQGDSRIAIRRLSHSALDNTVQDLLGVNLLLSEQLPADAELEGFENLAMTLDANPELVSKLQDNARTIANLAIHGGEDIREKRNFAATDIGFGTNAELRDGFVVSSSGRDRKSAMWPKGYVVPRDGLYRVRIKSYAGDNRWDLNERGIDYAYLRADVIEVMNEETLIPNDELRLGAIVAIQAEEARSVDSGTLPGRRVGYFYTGESVNSDEIEVRLNKGENIMVQFTSGSNLNNAPMAKVEGEEYLVANLLRVGEIGVEGPLMDSWPSDVHRQLILEKKTGVEDRVSDFLFRAFRRPVSENTLRIYLGLYEQGLNEGLGLEASMRSLVVAVLSSPRFLFNHDSGRTDDAWALASRLSYFLWNSMPDEELMKLAANGKLLKNRVLKKQTRRMLADEKRIRFVEDFTAQWLGLKDIHLMSPDPKLYASYDPLLEGLMQKESEVFFDRILTKNESPEAFLDSKFVMVNERLATHYEIEGVVGSAFRKVALPKDSPRGGLLGQASVLKLTSNGTRTSPVVRGVWVLENILGSPPSPPPADVEPIEPDVRGTKTIREMLSKHRDIESCRNCHQKIDPWGFGLEHFDAVGVFRKQYPNGSGIDAKGSVPWYDFDGAEEMKLALLARSDQFHRALTEKLYTYALGHPLTFAERLVADDLAETIHKRGKGLRDLIVEICMSPLFRGEYNHSQPAGENVASTGIGPPQR